MLTKQTCILGCTGQQHNRFLSGWSVLWGDHPVLPKLKGTAIGAFPLQEIAGNFYRATLVCVSTAGAQSSRLQGGLQGLKESLLQDRGLEGLGGGASGLALASETQLALSFIAATPVDSVTSRNAATTCLVLCITTRSFLTQ